MTDAKAKAKARRTTLDGLDLACSAQPRNATPDADPDPAAKRNQRMRTIAPTLVAALVAGAPDSAVQPAKPVDPKVAERRRKRAVKDASAAHSAAEAERRAEAIAPAVQRHPVTVKRLTEDGKQVTAVLRGPRLAVNGTRVQHASAIGVLAVRHKSQPSRIRVTPLHTIAGDLFATDFEELASGIGLGASDYAGKTGSGTRDPVALAGAQADQLGDQLWRREQLRRRLTALGKLADVLIHVAVRNGSLTAWAQENRTNASVALGYLVAALEVLVALYGGQQSLVEHRRATERARRPISSAAAPAAVAEDAEQQTA